MRNDAFCPCSASPAPAPAPASGPSPLSWHAYARHTAKDPFEIPLLNKVRLRGGQTFPCHPLFSYQNDICLARKQAQKPLQKQKTQQKNSKKNNQGRYHLLGNRLFVYPGHYILILRYILSTNQGTL